MWSQLFLFALISTSSARLHGRSSHVAREYVTDATRRDSYDFVVAGGGQAGLALATRLAAINDNTVLVIETGDEGTATLNTPAYTYYQSQFGSSRDYKFSTAPQPSAGGRNINWPRGKVLGGSAAINGMYMVRPHEIEINAWHDLVASESSADEWTWESLFAAMKQSETFTPATDASREVAGMQWIADSHGTNGPIHCTYPGYMVPLTSRWLPSLEAAGVAITSDAYSGKNIGGYFALSAINPSNWTRSYSKSGYLDPLPPKSNLHVLVNTTVTRIVFDSSATPLKAQAVEFASAKGAATSSVQVNKEVIVSGGTVNSPQILQLSGVGPRDVLEAVGVEVKLDLPGVGAHVQDHLSAGVYYATNEQTQGDIYASNSDLSKTPEFLSFVNSGTAYVNATTLFGADGATAMQQTIANERDSSASSLSTINSDVTNGYKAIYQAIAEKFYSTEVAQIELLFSINSAGQVAVQAALQHALSQGRIYINSNSAFDAPIIDPQYLTHWADVVTMREGLKLARKVANTAPLSEILGNEVTPGADVDTDEEWDAWLRQRTSTEFHPSSSCAMLPRNQGGVVDNRLKVYGTQNVRVVDASIFPVNFAAHLMAPVYGLVEKAAAIIDADYKPGQDNSGGGTSTGSGSGSNSGSNQENGANKMGFVSVSHLSLVAVLLTALLC